MRIPISASLKTKNKQTKKLKENYLAAEESSQERGEGGLMDKLLII